MEIIGCYYKVANAYQVISLDELEFFHAHTFQTRFLQLSVSHPNKVKHLSLFFHLKVSSNFTSLTQVHKQLQISIPCQAEHQL